MHNTWPKYSNNTRIVADALWCRRGGRIVFADLSFSLSSGHYICLRGRNGAGKSTLLRLIAGLVPESQGVLHIRNDAEIIDARESVLMVGHLNGLKPAMTLRANAMMFHHVMTGHPLDPLILDQAAARFSLTHLLDQPVQYFSSGQRHRSALMRFELVPRPIWLMDEPTVGLDNDNRIALTEMMQAHLKRDGMIISATHDPIEIEGAVLNMDDYKLKNTASHTMEDGWL